MEAQRFLFVTNAEAAVRGEKRMDDSPNVRVGEKVSLRLVISSYQG